MLYIIQDKREADNSLVVTATTSKMAKEIIRELEEIDRKDGVYEPNMYIARRRGICYNQASQWCGNCVKSICMLENPEKDCPKSRRKAAGGGGEDAGQQILAPAT